MRDDRCRYGHDSQSGACLSGIDHTALCFRVRSKESPAVARLNRKLYSGWLFLSSWRATQVLSRWSSIILLGFTGTLTVRRSTAVRHRCLLFTVYCFHPLGLPALLSIKKGHRAASHYMDEVRSIRLVSKDLFFFFFARLKERSWNQTRLSLSSPCGNMK